MKPKDRKPIFGVFMKPPQQFPNPVPATPSEVAKVNAATNFTEILSFNYLKILIGFKEMNQWQSQNLRTYFRDWIA